MKELIRNQDNFVISTQIEETLFINYSNRLVAEFGAVLIHEKNNPLLNFKDFLFTGKKLTLKLQINAGISIAPTLLEMPTEEEKLLAEKLCYYLGHTDMHSGSWEKMLIGTEIELIIVK